MKSFSPLYAFTKLMFSPSIKLFYQSIQSRNIKNISPDGAVLICCNHVNAFMDAVSIQLYTERQYFSLARGDAFRNPVLRWLLNGWKIIPIYRLSEGKENLKKNDATFAITQLVLKKGNPVIIYPEAICVQERRIRKLKKGAARIAFGFDEQNDFKKDLMILPVGMNYSNPPKFRSALFINVGEPIRISEFSDFYRTDKGKAINALTSALEESMKELVVHVEHKENDRLVEVLFDIYKPVLIRTLGRDPRNLEDDFIVAKMISNAVNRLTAQDHLQVDKIKHSLFGYKSKLDKYKLNDKLLVNKKQWATETALLVCKSFLILSGLPFLVFGLATNYLPYLAGSYAAKRIAKNIEFQASVQLVVGWFSWMFYYLLQLIFAAFYFRNLLLTGLTAVFIPLSCNFVLSFLPFLEDYWQRLKVIWFREKNKVEFKNLLTQREKLLDFLGSAFLVFSKP